MALAAFRGEAQPSEPVLLDTKLVTTDNVASYIGWDAER
jgi:ribose transport system substrate-binding protein